MTTEGGKVTAAYRALGAEEPPRALDEAILAASRRPAVQPWTRRYAVPLSLAAVLVLSVTVTLRIQHEAPGIESPVAVREQTVPQSPAPAPVESQAALKLKPEGRLKSADAPRERMAARLEPKPFADARRDAAPEANAAAPVAPAQPAGQGRLEEHASRADASRSAESSVAGSAARQSEERVARDAEAAARAPQVGPLAALVKRSQASADSAPAAASPPAAAAAPAAKPAAPATAKLERAAESTPAQEFERIAALRAEGRHDEADKAFLEFRKRHPEFRITEDMLRRVERR